MGGSELMYLPTVGYFRISKKVGYPMSIKRLMIELMEQQYLTPIFVFWDWVETGEYDRPGLRKVMEILDRGNMMAMVTMHSSHLSRYPETARRMMKYWENNKHVAVWSLDERNGVWKVG